VTTHISQAPIPLSKEGVDWFVGRGDEIRRMINKWSNRRDGCLTVIGGNIGTGKTSFLNACQWVCFTGVQQFGLEIEPPMLVPCVNKYSWKSSRPTMRYSYGCSCGLRGPTLGRLNRRAGSARDPSSSYVAGSIRQRRQLEPQQARAARSEGDFHSMVR